MRAVCLLGRVVEFNNKNASCLNRSLHQLSWRWIAVRDGKKIIVVKGFYSRKTTTLVPIPQYVSYVDYLHNILESRLIPPIYKYCNNISESRWLGCPGQTVSIGLTAPPPSAIQSSRLCPWRTNWKVLCTNIPDSYFRDVLSTKCSSLNAQQGEFFTPIQKH